MLLLEDGGLVLVVVFIVVVFVLVDVGVEMYDLVVGCGFSFVLGFVFIWFLDFMWFEEECVVVGFIVVFMFVLN